MKNPSKPELLLIIKQFFNEAERLLSLGDDFSTMKATLFLDLAVEQMLNVLINDFSEGASAGRNDIAWNKLWQEAKIAVTKADVMKCILHFKELKVLHEVRNLVQHHGHKANTADISQSLVPVKKMISDCFTKCYGFNFEEFRIWDTIQNLQLQLLLRESEDALAHEGAIFTMAGALMAFTKITAAIRANGEGFAFSAGFSSAFNIDSLQDEINLHLSVFESGAIGDCGSEHYHMIKLIGRLKELMENITTMIISEMRSEVSTLRNDAEVANLGLPMAKTRRFREIINTVNVHESQDGEWVILELEKKTHNEYKQDALFALEYLSSLILLVQETYPESLNKVNILTPLTEQPEWKKFIKTKNT